MSPTTEPFNYNILVFVADQLRSDCLGCYGNPVISTPHIDGLAAHGVRFTRYYTQNPTSYPSRATMLSGLYPRAHGVWAGGVPFSRGATTIPQFFRDHGYATALAGDISINPEGAAEPEQYARESFHYWDTHPEVADWHGPDLGFDHVDLALGTGEKMNGHYKHYLLETFPQGIELLRREKALEPLNDTVNTWKNAMPVEHHYNTWIAQQARDQIRRNRDGKFLLWCGFADPHFPFSAPYPYCDTYTPGDLPSPLRSDEEHRTMPPHFADFIRLYSGTQSDRNFGEITAQYYAMIHYVDECIGSILRELDVQGLRERTIVIFTTDHGELLGDHGLLYKGPYLYQSLVRIPFIISIPSLSGEPRIVDSPVGHIDLFPSLVDLVGASTPSHLQGRSWLPIVDGRRERTHDAVLTEYHDVYPKLDTTFNMKCLHVDRWKLVCYAARDYGELYDLGDDPQEFRNLHGLPQYRDVVRDLEARLLRVLIETEGEWPEILSGPEITED